MNHTIRKLVKLLIPILLLCNYACSRGTQVTPAAKEQARLEAGLKAERIESLEDLYSHLAIGMKRDDFDQGLKLDILNSKEPDVIIRDFMRAARITKLVDEKYHLTERERWLALDYLSHGSAWTNDAESIVKAIKPSAQ